MNYKSIVIILDVPLNYELVIVYPSDIWINKPVRKYENN